MTDKQIHRAVNIKSHKLISEVNPDFACKKSCDAVADECSDNRNYNCDADTCRLSTELCKLTVYKTVTCTAVDCRA